MNESTSRNVTKFNMFSYVNAKVNTMMYKYHLQPLYIAVYIFPKNAKRSKKIPHKINPAPWSALTNPVMFGNLVP